MITDQDLEFMRKSHESLMYDFVRIYRDGEMEWDEELGRMVETQNSLIYEGKARVVLDKADGVIVGESMSTINRTTGYVTIPAYSVENIAEGDRVVVPVAYPRLPAMYATSVGKDSFKSTCTRFAVVTDRNQIGGK